MGRSSWLAIRTPLAPRRATVAKFAAFLLPLGLWALVCAVWVPDIIITDPGDGYYGPKQRLPREAFESENARIAGLPPAYRVTSQALEAMKKDVPAPLIATIGDRFGPTNDNPRGFAFTDQKDLLLAVVEDDPDIDDYIDKIWKLLEKDPQSSKRRLTEAAWKSLESQLPPETLKKIEVVKPKAKADGQVEVFAWSNTKQLSDSLAATRYDPQFNPDVVKAWNHLEKETKQPKKGDPSTKEWLPSPWQVAKAFYVAFVTPPVGAGYKVNSDTVDAMRKHGVTQPVLDKLNPLLGKSFDYEDKDKFVETLGKTLTPEEMHSYQNTIVKNAYVQTDPWLHQSLWISCKTIFWAFFLSAMLGIPLGILCGTFDFFSKLNEPFIDFVRYMPAPAFGVACMAILGINLGPKIAIIWIGTFFQMVLVVANTTRQFDPALLEAAQTLGASKRSLLLKVILPGILPNLYNDMRILLGWAWTYLIVAEVIGSQSGISEFIYRARSEVSQLRKCLCRHHHDRHHRPDVRSDPGRPGAVPVPLGAQERSRPRCVGSVLRRPGVPDPRSQEDLGRRQNGDRQRITAIEEGIL